MTPLQRVRIQVWLQERIGLFTVLVIVAVAAVQGLGWHNAYGRIRDVDALLARAEAVTPPDAKTDEKPGQQGPPQQKQPKDDIFKRQKVNYQLSAIMNEQALINGRMCKAGDRIQSATVIAVAQFSVTIHEDQQDNPRDLHLFSQGGGGQGGPPPGMNRGPRGGGRRSSGGRRAESRGRMGMPPGVPRQIPRDANLGRLSGMSIPQVMRGLRDGTIGIDEVPAEHRERAKQMMQGGRGRDGGGRARRGGGR